MNSTFDSKELILSVKNLNLIFDIKVHPPWTFRDLFVQKFSRSKENENSSHRLSVANNLSFDIYKGERVGLLGVNGTGKTSLCRCIAGMYHPTSGSFQINGLVRAVFDTQVGILPELTGRENAELLVHFLFPGIEDKKAKAVVLEALDFSELGKFVDAPFKTYSMGMQARFWLSLVSADSANLLILDEVFDGADIFFKEKIERRVLNMIHNAGAVIFVTHSLEQLTKVCNRVLVLDQGDIIFDGRPSAAIEIYKSINGENSGYS